MATLEWTYEKPARVWDLGEIESLVKQIYKRAETLRSKGISDEEIRSIVSWEDSRIMEFSKTNSHATIFHVITTAGQPLDPILHMITLRGRVNRHELSEIEARKEYRALEKN